MEPQGAQDNSIGPQKIVINIGEIVSKGISDLYTLGTSLGYLLVYEEHVLIDPQGIRHHAWHYRWGHQDQLLEESQDQVSSSLEHCSQGTKPPVGLKQGDQDIC